MQTIPVDTLTFEFPDHWTVARFDQWLFYKNSFQSVLGGCKAVDLIALDDSPTAWFIEVKDYRVHPRTKPSCLALETAEKVFDTLAALLPARVNGTIPTEADFVRVLHDVTSIKVVLHVEQPAAGGVWTLPISPMNLQLKLKQLLNAVDSSPLVCDMTTASGLQWLAHDPNASTPPSHS